MKNVSVMQSPVVSMTTQSGNHAAVQKTSDQSSQAVPRDQMQLVVTESGVALCRPSVVDSQVRSKFYAVIWYCFQISIPTARGVVKGRPSSRCSVYL